MCYTSIKLFKNLCKDMQEQVTLSDSGKESWVPGEQAWEEHYQILSYTF